MPTLLILMPTSGQIDTPAVHSLLGLTQALPNRGIRFALKTYEWSDLVISRNYLMSVFLADKKFSHALLLDSDMSYRPQVFFDLLDFDADFTCAPYPQRQMRWSTFRALVEREAEKPEAERAPTGRLISESLRYNVSEAFDAGQPWPYEARGGFRKVPGAGTGFMLIRRAVPERMVETGVERAVEVTCSNDNADSVADGSIHSRFGGVGDTGAGRRINTGVDGDSPCGRDGGGGSNCRA